MLKSSGEKYLVHNIGVHNKLELMKDKNDSYY